MSQIDVSPTQQPQAICVGTLGADDASEALLLQGAVGLVQVGLPVAVHHAPLAVQDAETVAGRQSRGQREEEPTWSAQFPSSTPGTWNQT